jgi:hypothetical protein
LLQTLQILTEIFWQRSGSDRRPVLCGSALTCKQMNVFFPSEYIPALSIRHGSWLPRATATLRPNKR